MCEMTVCERKRGECDRERFDAIKIWQRLFMSTSKKKKKKKKKNVGLSLSSSFISSFQTLAPTSK